MFAVPVPGEGDENVLDDLQELAAKVTSLLIPVSTCETKTRRNQVTRTHSLQFCKSEKLWHFRAVLADLIPALGAEVAMKSPPPAFVRTNKNVHLLSIDLH